MKNIFGHKNNVILYNSDGLIRYTYCILRDKFVEIFYNDDGEVIKKKEELKYEVKY
jgi:hypothetical protein